MLTASRRVSSREKGEEDSYREQTIISYFLFLWIIFLTFWMIFLTFYNNITFVNRREREREREIYILGMLYAEMGERMTEKTEDELKRELKSISEIFGNLDFIEAYNEEEKLAEIVKDETEKYLRNDEGFRDSYILLNREIYPKEVIEGKRSPSDIYAHVVHYVTVDDFREFLFDINYLHLLSVINIIIAHLRKSGFSVYMDEQDLLPTPNLKYYIIAVVDYAPGNHWLGVNIYNVDDLVKSFNVPQIVAQRLGNKPRKVITKDEVDDIKYIVGREQPILVGQTYYDAWGILYNYYVKLDSRRKDEAYKIALAYAERFPAPYQACYNWGDGEKFVKTECPQLDLSNSPS